MFHLFLFDIPNIEKLLGIRGNPSVQIVDEPNILLVDCDFAGNLDSLLIFELVLIITENQGLIFNGEAYLTYTKYSLLFFRPVKVNYNGVVLAGLRFFMRIDLHQHFAIQIIKFEMVPQHILSDDHIDGTAVKGFIDFAVLVSLTILNTFGIYNSIKELFGIPNMDGRVQIHLPQVLVFFWFKFRL